MTPTEHCAASAPRRSRLFGALLSLLMIAPALWAGTLDDELEGVLAESSFASKLNLSVCIIDEETGRVLADHRAQRQMIPASNMKLLTSGAALNVLGEDFEFITELVLLEGDGPGGTDRLVVRGSGDPAFADPKLLDDMGVTVEEFIGHWIDAIMNSDHPGSIGEIVMDTRIFDRELIHDSWPKAQLNRWYCAQVSGINFHTNVLRVYTRPTEVGQRPLVTVEPDVPWLDLRNKAKTVGGKKKHTAWASRAMGTNVIGLHADVRHAAAPIEVTVHEPAMILGRVLATRLAARQNSQPVVRLAEETEDLLGGQVLHRVRTPLAVALERCNVNSYNLYAEALLKRTGAEAAHSVGTWERGAFALRSLITDNLGPEFAAVGVFADGSGMSRENRVTTSLLANWLRFMNDGPHAKAFRESLPSVNRAEGTLHKRFRGKKPENQVIAKTGYLSGVSALSGYVISDDGRTIIFSIISNDKPSDVALASVRALEEDIVRIIDQHLTSDTIEISHGG